MAERHKFAQRGTGDVGPAIMRADGVLLPRENKLRGRDYFSLFGKFTVARTCYRLPGRAWRCWGSRRLCQFLDLHIRVPALEDLSQFAVQSFHAGL